MQASDVGVWHLLSMVRTGTVCLPRAFRLVDVAVLLTFALGVVRAPGIVLVPGPRPFVVVLRALPFQAWCMRVERDEVI